MAKTIKVKVYRHIYDSPKWSDKDFSDPKMIGKDKPNKLLGEFLVSEEDWGNRCYSFEVVGIKDGKKYNIIGHEVTIQADRYRSGTKCFVELIGDVKDFGAVLAELKQIVIEDVPHQYQDRLLEKLENHRKLENWEKEGLR